MKDVTFKMTKSKDGEGRDSLTIEIDKKSVFIPMSILADFINSEHKNIEVTIPN